MKMSSEKCYSDRFKIIAVALCFISACLITEIVLLIIVVVNVNSLSYYPLQTHSTELIELTSRPAAIYKGYLKMFNKDYGSAEAKRRFQFFKESLKEISHLNQVTGAVHGLTKFSDMAKNEFPDTSSLNLGECITKDNPCGNEYYSSSKRRARKEKEEYNSICTNFYPNEVLPNKFDWREQHMVGPVLDQKRCNGCWAFGIVGVAESMAAINSSKLGAQRSIQELLDCSPYTDGCYGGHVGWALKWLCESQWGLVTEDEYPLKLVNENCAIKDSDTYDGLRIKHFCQLCFVNNVDDILRLIHFHGPVMAIVDSAPLRSYIDGVIQWSCFRDGQSDHVVQIVGYDKTVDVPHFIIRNSWGEDFGIGGYFKLALKGNVCGVTDEISFFDVYKKFLRE